MAINMIQDFQLWHMSKSTYAKRSNFETRMHSSRIRTAHCSGHLIGGGGRLQRGCLPREYLPWRYLPRRVYTFPLRGQTDTCENITLPQLLLRTVKMPIYQ